MDERSKIFLKYMELVTSKYYTPGGNHHEHITLLHLIINEMVKQEIKTGEEITDIDKFVQNFLVGEEEYNTEKLPRPEDEIPI